MQTKKVTKNWIPGYIIVTALIAVLYLPIFVWLVQSWLNNPYYGHGFLVLLVSGSIFWLRRCNLKLEKRSLLGAAVLGVGLVLYVLAFIWRMQPLAAFSLLIVVFGIVTYLCGNERAKLFTFPILFLIFMIPVLFLTSMSYFLQTIVTHSSAAIAHLSGIPTIVTGNQIELSSASFNIGAPCSGISSLISLSALAAILAFLVDGPFWKRTILFLSAFPIAIVANIFRVGSILIVANKWGSEVAINFFHGFSGILLFLVAVALLFLVVGLLRCKFRTLRELAHERI